MFCFQLCNAFERNNNISVIKRDVTHHFGEIDLASACCTDHLCNRNWPAMNGKISFKHIDINQQLKNVNINKTEKTDQVRYSLSY